MRKDFGKRPLIYPQPVLIVGTYNDDGSPDVMTAAWGGVGDDHQVFLCLSPEHKTVKNIQQFYDDKDIVRIAGESGVKVDSPSRVRDVEADISIVQSQATPVSRAINNDFLMELFREKAINIKQLLENGNFPFKDKLLQSIETQQEQIANGETPQGIPPEVMQQVNAGANPAAVQQLQQNGMA